MNCPKCDVCLGVSSTPDGSPQYHCMKCGWASDSVNTLVASSPSYRLAKLQAEGAKTGWYGSDYLELTVGREPAGDKETTMESKVTAMKRQATWKIEAAKRDLVEDIRRCRQALETLEANLDNHPESFAEFPAQYATRLVRDAQTIAQQREVVDMLDSIEGMN